jgi:hypothetical protein
MKKLLTTCALIAGVATLAIAVTTTPSLAAKKKKVAAKPATCTAPASMRGPCNNGVCQINWCGVDGKWYPAPLFCVEPFCLSPKG